MIPDTPDQMPERLRYQVSELKIIKHRFDYRKKKPVGKRMSKLDDYRSISFL